MLARSPAGLPTASETIRPALNVPTGFCQFARDGPTDARATRSGRPTSASRRAARRWPYTTHELEFGGEREDGALIERHAAGFFHARHPRGSGGRIVVRPGRVTHRFWVRSDKPRRKSRIASQRPGVDRRPNRGRVDGPSKSSKSKPQAARLVADPRRGSRDGRVRDARSGALASLRVRASMTDDVR